MSFELVDLSKPPAHFGGLWTKSVVAWEGGRDGRGLRGAPSRSLGREGGGPEHFPLSLSMPWTGPAAVSQHWSGN